MAKHYGWVRKDPSHPMLFLKHYIMDPRAVVVPDQVNWTNNSRNPFTILGNGDYGNCVEAMMYHADQVMGSDYVPTDSDALGLYSTLTGFNPNVPASDQGTQIPVALDWWLTNPLPGSGTTLGAYFSLDVRDHTEIALSLWLGGAVAIGFDVPYSAEQQFDQHLPWTVVPGSPIVGGHSTVITMNTASAALEGNITWGEFQTLTYKFWNKYVSEAYGLFAEEWVSPTTGSAPNHIAWADLNADILSVYGKPGPFTGVVSPPAPSPSVDAVGAMDAITGIVQNWNGA